MSKLTREQLAVLDFQDLAQNDKFLRVIWTILDTAGMFTGNYQPDGRNHAFAEGRRSLGLDILRSTEKALGQDALQRILEAENKTLKEAPSARRTADSDDRNPDRDDGSNVDHGHGIRYLDYGSD